MERKTTLRNLLEIGNVKVDSVLVIQSFILKRGDNDENEKAKEHSPREG
jgi:hypothetical protein